MKLITSALCLLVFIVSNDVEARRRHNLCDSPLRRYVNKRLCDDYVVPRRHEVNGEKTFRLYKNSKTWYEARQSCTDEGGQLAVIENEHEESEMHILMKEATTLWLHTGFHMLFVDYITVDGKPLVYQHWDPSEPNGNFRTQPCGGIARSNAYLVDNDCNWRFNYVCEFKEEEEKNEQLVYIVNRQNLRWPDARRNCSNLGGHLPLLTTEMIFNTVKKFAKDQHVENFWIGYHNMFKTKGVIMDTGKAPESHFLEWNRISESPGYASMHTSGQVKVENAEAKRQSICAIPLKYCDKSVCKGPKRSYIIKMQ